MRSGEHGHVASSWLAQVIVGKHWRAVAACRAADPDLFFPVSASANNLQPVADAKAICGCGRGRLECLGFALRTRQLHGIWAGMTEEERYPLTKPEHQVGSAPEASFPPMAIPPRHRWKRSTRPG
jgi:WhiB family transcriptional regulator, redox-sensing transcriptional regulator